jgi:hypothetical protein
MARAVTCAAASALASGLVVACGGAVSTAGPGEPDSATFAVDSSADVTSRDASLAPADDSNASTEGSLGTPDQAAQSSEASAGPCNSVPEPTRSAQVQLVTGSSMGSTGGVIAEGRYELESANVYVASAAGPSIESRVHAISISGSTWASVSYFDSTPTARYNDQARLSGNSVTLRRACGDQSAGILFGTQGTYTATDQALILNFDAGPSFGNGTAVLTFVRSPLPDAGASPCIGTPCTNSFACCPVAGGGPPIGIACGASGTCEACTANGLNDPCLGGGPNGGPDCCAGLRCLNNRCVR